LISFNFEIPLVGKLAAGSSTVESLILGLEQDPCLGVIGMQQMEWA